jgi:cholesterol transport system auxiliary component
MTATPRAFLRCLTLAAGLALSACAVPGFRDPPQLHSLTPATGFPADLPQVREQLLVELPIANSGLDVSQIALRTSPTSLAYFADVNWTDRAPALIQTLIVESLENTGRIVSVARDTVGLRADWLLKTELRDFQAEYAGQPGRSAPGIRMRLTAKLVRMPGRTIEDSRTFEAVVPAGGVSMQAVIDAFDTAAGMVMRDLAAWTLRSIPPAAS